MEKIDLKAYVKNGNRQSIPQETLEDPKTFQRIYENGKTGFHTILQSADQSDNIPKCVWEMLTQSRENLSLADQQGETPMHILAGNQEIRRISLEFLLKNPDLLEIPDEERETPLHRAATSGLISQIYPELFTQKNLNLRDKDGKTPISQAAWEEILNQIPRRFLTKANVIETLDKNNSDCIQLLTWEKTRNIYQVPIEILAAYRPPKNSLAKKNFLEILEAQPEIAQEIRKFKVRKRAAKNQVLIKDLH